MRLKVSAPQENETGMSYAYRTLKQNIMSLRLSPGQMIPEKDISAALKVSRTPIREALQRLRAENLVEIFPQRASYVTRIDFDWIEESLFMRRIIETEIMKTVVRNKDSSLMAALTKNLSYQEILCRHLEDFTEFLDLDNQFHEIIYVHCRKARIWKTIQTFGTHYDRLRFLYLEDKEHIETIISQHRSILRMIENKEAERIQALIPDHLMNFRGYKDELILSHPDFFKQ